MKDFILCSSKDVAARAVNVFPDLGLVMRVGVVRGAKTDASPKTGNEASLIQRVQICFGEVSGGCRSVRIGPLSIQKRYHLFYDTPSTSIQIGL